MLSMSTSAKVKTPSRVCTVDVTDSVRCAVRDAGVAGSGQVSVLPMHTSCAVTVNENEPRLADDIRQLLASIAPAGAAYLHDDIWLREAPPGHDPEEWRSNEPVNADSHLRAMLLGASETLPLEHGDLALGTWQSVLLVELDGPNNRSVKLNVMGSTSPESG